MSDLDIRIESMQEYFGDNINFSWFDFSKEFNNGQQRLINYCLNKPENKPISWSKLCEVINPENPDEVKKKFISHVGHLGRAALRYEHPDLFSFYIIDNQGYYASHESIYISPKNEDGTGADWTYCSHKCADIMFVSQEVAQKALDRIQELAILAGFEGLEWKIVYANERDIPDPLAGMDRIQRVFNGSVFVRRDIPVGHITEHKKAEKEIINKYKFASVR